jgi:hypothetical protein
LIHLSNTQAKYANRKAGVEFAMRWPAGLAVPTDLSAEMERPATAVEEAFVRTLLAPECDRLDLVVTEVMAFLARFPCPERTPAEPCLSAWTVSRNFLRAHQASGERGRTCWITPTS